MSDKSNSWKETINADGLLSQSKSPRTRRQKTILYSVPLLALSILLAIIYLEVVPGQARMDYTLNISIQISVLDPTSFTGASVTTVIPRNVGIAGGIWKSDQYDGYGLDGKYPVFAQAPAGWNNTWQYYLIHVRSRVAWNYTLLDFFNVWGMPLGQNNTLGYTVPRPDAQSNLYGQDWFWDMCFRPAGGTFRDTTRVAPDHWGSQPLDRDILIILIYSNYGCSPA